MKVANDPEAGATDLLRIIENDPPLCSRVLRMLRSARFGIRNEITELRQAVSYLGFCEIRNLAMAGSVSEAFQRDLRIGGYSRPGLWEHLAAVALCSRMVARRLRIPNSDDAFLAGLLHDLGILLIDQHRNDQFKDVLGQVKAGASLTRIEHGILGFDHTALGSAFAEKWKFPALIAACMRHHHEPSAYKGPRKEIVACVSVANFLCSMTGHSSVGTNLITPPMAAFEHLELTKNDLIVFGEDLPGLIAASPDLFQLGRR